mmetsp:Transcript_39947/g.107919  ORF Transcript_39947/g.107919 Transcript_39947/m.107919 type:complete len:259 (-) Transcript_39947:884-1660(-)
MPLSIRRRLPAWPNWYAVAARASALGTSGLLRSRLPACPARTRSMAPYLLPCVGQAQKPWKASQSSKRHQSFVPLVSDSRSPLPSSTPPSMCKAPATTEPSASMKVIWELKEVPGHLLSHPPLQGECGLFAKFERTWQCSARSWRTRRSGGAPLNWSLDKLSAEVMVVETATSDTATSPLRSPRKAMPLSTVCMLRSYCLKSSDVAGSGALPKSPRARFSVCAVTTPRSTPQSPMKWAALDTSWASKFCSSMCGSLAP